MEPSETKELAAQIERRRKELGYNQPAAKTVPSVYDVAEAPAQTPEQLAAIEARWKAEQAEADRRKKTLAWNALIEQRGERYRDCKLDSFDASLPAQQAVVVALRGYCEAVAENVAEGRGIVLFGPKGTGKDHLAVAVCREAIRAGFSVRWVNGMDLFGDIRDRIGADEPESALIRRLANPQVLYMSDPIPPVGKLTDFQASMLFRILDARYSHMRATICTVNSSTAAEAEERLGPQNADRLRDGALALFCNWASYRRASKQ